MRYFEAVRREPEHVVRKLLCDRELQRDLWQSKSNITITEQADRIGRNYRIEEDKIQALSRSSAFLKI